MAVYWLTIHDQHMEVVAVYWLTIHDQHMEVVAVYRLTIHDQHMESVAVYWLHCACRRSRHTATLIIIRLT